MKLEKALIEAILNGTASASDVLAADREEVLAVKSDPEAVHRAYVVKRRPRSLNAEQRTVQYVASDEGVDRMGDRISVKGWDLGNFKRNPVLLWDHNPSRPENVLGTVPDIEKSKDGGSGGAPALLATARFHDAEKNSAADIVFRMVADGDLPAVSVGFRALETKRPRSDDEVREMGLGPYGVYFVKQELMELSVVAVPAHPGALAKKLDLLAEEGTFSWAAINDVERAIKAWEQRGGRTLIAMGGHDIKSLEPSVPDAVDVLPVGHNVPGGLVRVPTELGLKSLVRQAVDSALAEIREDVARTREAVEALVMRGAGDHGNVSDPKLGNTEPGPEGEPVTRTIYDVVLDGLEKALNSSTQEN